MVELREMMARHGGAGKVAWIGLRPARRADMEIVTEAEIDADGLLGDRAKSGKRAVTLIQAEHLPVIAALARRAVSPEMLRRNIVVSGINLAALRKGQVRLGTAVLEVSGPCPPCSRMEETLGHGGYSAVRGHGGMYASVLAPGIVSLGDAVTPA
ncbi:MAG: MOSC domain-containing protein [Pseudomonadota bacterium]